MRDTLASARTVFRAGFLSLLVIAASNMFNVKTKGGGNTTLAGGIDKFATYVVHEVPCHVTRLRDEFRRRVLYTVQVEEVLVEEAARLRFLFARHAHGTTGKKGKSKSKPEAVMAMRDWLAMLEGIHVVCEVGGSASASASARLCVSCAASRARSVWFDASVFACVTVDGL